MTRPGQTWDDSRVQPCGTPAAYRRHQRRGEPLCQACRAAVSTTKSTGERRVLIPDTRPVRNGLPEFRPYVYRGTGRDELTGWMQ